MEMPAKQAGYRGVCMCVCVCVQVSGVVFFSSSVSERLLQTHVTPPLDGCTYLGLDSGAPPLQVVAAVTMVAAAMTTNHNDRCHDHTA